MKITREQARRHLNPRDVAVAAASLAIALSGNMVQSANAQPDQKLKTGAELAQKHPAVTPLQALTGVITRIKERETASVTMKAVRVAGPIGVADAHPIEFSDNGKRYFAYAQERRPNFREEASKIAGSMAIVEYQSSEDNGAMVELDPARLNRAGVLVDTRTHEAVGFSIGGDSGK